jgi:hypothetical protein
MPFNSRAFRVLIASPSDVEQEREIAVKVIQEWNDLYSYTRGVVLLPLRWETHASPEYGTRPQEVINKAIVDQCDLLVGIFWTRIGTPTGIADSGTLEEILRVAKAGKPIMLYFSRVGADPAELDLVQVERLNAFKVATASNALTESYKSHIDFRDKFARQLELKVRDLQRADAAGGPPPISVAVASDDLKLLEPSPASRQVEVIHVSDFETGIRGDDKAIERRRAALRSYLRRAATSPIVLAITNSGPSSIRNLYIEIDVSASEGLSVADKAPPRARRTIFDDAIWHMELKGFESDVEPDWKVPEAPWTEDFELEDGFKKTDHGWRLAFEWSALQPNRTRFVKPVLFVTAKRSGNVTIQAKVFADALAEPVSLELLLEVAVLQREVRVAELLEGSGPSSA